MVGIMRRSAQSSFSDQVTSFVINLDHRADRWRRVRTLCRLQGIDVRRFSAHDGERLSAEHPQSPLTKGELGLWSSVHGVLSTLVETQWILIFEDDAVPLPRFRRHVLREIRSAGDDVLMMRLGWLGRFAWLPNDSFGTFLRRAVRVIVRAGRRRLTRSGDVRGTRGSVSPWGTQCLLVRTAHVDRVLDELGPMAAPLDVALFKAEARAPQQFIRPRRNRAWQWPSRSDIEIERVALFPSRAQRASRRRAFLDD